MDVRHHREQQRFDWCVLACIDMVLAARNRPGIQQNPPHQERWGFPPGLAAQILDGSARQLPVDDPLLDLRVALGNGHVVMVEVCGPLYVKHLGSAPAGHPSRFGDLCDPGDFGAPWHTVVLIGEDPAQEAFLALDPYYPAHGQPVVVPYDVLVAIMTLRAVIA